MTPQKTTQTQNILKEKHIHKGRKNKKHAERTEQNQDYEKCGD